MNYISVCAYFYFYFYFSLCFIQRTLITHADYTKDQRWHFSFHCKNDRKIQTVTYNVNNLGQIDIDIHTDAKNQLSKMHDISGRVCFTPHLFFLNIYILLF